MPLYAFDQFQVCPRGSEPELTGDLEGLGMRRSDGAKAYVAALRKALEELSTEHARALETWNIGGENMEKSAFRLGNRRKSERFGGLWGAQVYTFCFWGVSQFLDCVRPALRRSCCGWCQGGRSAEASCPA